MVELKRLHPPGSKRDRTRNRLLVATQALLRERRAGALSIRDISQHAGVSHGTFYNYYDSLEDLFDNLALLFAFTHAACLDQVTTGRTDVAEVFSISTRQTLRFVADSPDFAFYIFDAGLSIDHLVNGLRLHMRADLRRGIDSRTFNIADIDLAVSLVSGALLGLTLGLHRGELDRSVIEPATEELLRMLGVEANRAEELARIEANFVRPPAVPFQWPIE
jgi:AcrR family transcriptional regulator